MSSKQLILLFQLPGKFLVSVSVAVTKITVFTNNMQKEQ